MREYVLRLVVNHQSRCNPRFLANNEIVIEIFCYCTGIVKRTHYNFTSFQIYVDSIDR